MRTKRQYVNRLSELTGFTKADTRAFLKAQEVAILDCLERGVTGIGLGLHYRTVKIPGVVKVIVAQTPPKPRRRALNPATGQTIMLPEKPTGYRLKVRFLKKAKQAAGMVVRPRYGKLEASPPIEVIPKPKSKNRYQREPVI
jgi:nucleoid DNA-binding protein